MRGKQVATFVYRSSISEGHDHEMARHRFPHFVNSDRRRRLSRSAGWRTIGECLLAAVVLGGAAGWGLNQFDQYRAAQAKRQALLAALPAGYVFPGCNAVRAHGLAPLFRGEPGFSDYMDGDRDGIACEPYP